MATTDVASLSKAYAATIQALLSPTESALSSVYAAQLFVSKPVPGSGSGPWQLVCRGALLLVIDRARKATVIRGYDVQAGIRLAVDAEIPYELRYIILQRGFHVVELDDCLLGMQFAREDEALRFNAKVEQLRPRPEATEQGLGGAAPSAVISPANVQLPGAGTVAGTRTSLISSGFAKTGSVRSSLLPGTASLFSQPTQPMQPSAPAAAPTHEKNRRGSQTSQTSATSDDGAAAGGDAPATKKKGGVRASLARIFGRGDDDNRRGSKREIVVGDIIPGTFKHEGHVGLTDDGIFDVKNIPKEWRDMFRQLGVRPRDLKADPEMARALLKVLEDAPAVADRRTKALERQSVEIARQQEEARTHVAPASSTTHAAAAAPGDAPPPLPPKRKAGQPLPLPSVPASAPAPAVEAQAPAGIDPVVVATASSVAAAPVSTSTTQPTNAYIEQPPQVPLKRKVAPIPPQEQAAPVVTAFAPAPAPAPEPAEVAAAAAAAASADAPPPVPVKRKVAPAPPTEATTAGAGVATSSAAGGAVDSTAAGPIAPMASTSGAAPALPVRRKAAPLPPAEDNHLTSNPAEATVAIPMSVAASGGPPPVPVRRKSLPQIPGTEAASAAASDPTGVDATPQPAVQLPVTPPPAKAAASSTAPPTKGRQPSILDGIKGFDRAKLNKASDASPSQSQTGVGGRSPVSRSPAGGGGSADSALLEKLRSVVMSRRTSVGAEAVTGKDDDDSDSEWSDD